MPGTAFDSGALTLDNYAMQSNDPLVKKITYSLLQNANVLADIPLTTQNTLVRKGIRFLDNLPGVNYKPLGGLPTIVRGKPSPYWEQVFIVRNGFQIDEALMDEENAIEDPLDTQVNAWLTNFTFDTNTKFLLNKHDGSGGVIGDSNAPAGLAWRLANQSLYGIDSDCLIDGGGVLLSTAMTQATANQFIENVQQQLDYMGSSSGEGVVFYCNDLLKRRWERAIRVLGAAAGFTTDKDAFDRSVDMYKSAKIRDVGRMSPSATGQVGLTPSQNYPIIPYNETSAGAYPTTPARTNTVLSGGSYTSLYAVRYGEGYFGGWQTAPLKPKPLGLDPTNGVAYNVVVNWKYGLWQQHSRAVTRQFDIALA